MSLNELFTVNTRVRLTSDTNSWGDQIVTQLLNKFPTLSKVVGEVSFPKVEPIKGYAVGYISLIGKTQRIPFIVDERELNPLDIYIDNGNFLPLTESAIHRIESRSWPFRLISQSERSSILKTASLFEDTGGCLKNDFINKNKDILQKIAMEHFDVIDTFCNRNLNNDKDEFVVRCFVKEASDSKPIVSRDLVGPDREYKISDFADKFGKDVVEHLMLNGELIISNLEPRIKCQIDKMEVRSAYKPSSKRTGCIFVNGQPVRSHLYDHYNFSDLKSSYSWPVVAITNSGYFSYIDKLYEKNGDLSNEINLTSPQMGDYAFFTIGDNAYGPVFVNSISKMNDTTIYHITDNKLNQLNVKISGDIKTVVKLDDKNYLFSKNGKIIKVEPLDNREKKPDEIIKTSSLKIDINRRLNGKISISDNGVSGIEMSKLANMDKSDAVIALMKIGLSEDDSKYALLRANAAGNYSFNYESLPPIANNDVDDNLIKKSSEIVKLCSDNYILKTAAATGDASNIDLALGLNLIDHKNIKRFKLIIPDIFVMLDKLCKLLVIKRMNRSLFDLDESELTKCISALDAIATSLNSL